VNHPFKYMKIFQVSENSRKEGEKKRNKKMICVVSYLTWYTAG